MTSLSSQTHQQRQSPVSPYVFAGFTGDRSGSMCGIHGESSQGLFEWATELIESASKNNQIGRLFITSFDDTPERRVDNECFRNVNLTIEKCRSWMLPRGTTRLYDTAIEDLENIVGKAAEFRRSLPKQIRDLKPEMSIVWVCCTDGFDNASTNTAVDLKNKVIWARNQGVKCFFLAANQDAVTTGEKYGFGAGTSLTYATEPGYAANAFRSVSVNMTSASRGNNYKFTALQRETSTPQHTQQHTQQHALQHTRQQAHQTQSAPRYTMRNPILNTRSPPLQSPPLLGTTHNLFNIPVSSLPLNIPTSPLRRNPRRSASQSPL